MSKRHMDHHVLQIAVFASAMVSVALATAVTTAQIVRSRNVHYSASEVVTARESDEQEAAERAAAANKEKAERQQEQAQKSLRDLRMGN